VLAACFMLVSCLAYSLALKIEATYSCETSVLLQRTTRRCIPEDRTVHNHHCENLILTDLHELSSLSFSCILWHTTYDKSIKIYHDCPIPLYCSYSHSHFTLRSLMTCQPSLNSLNTIIFDIHTCGRTFLWENMETLS
jgi:hypothetical protein